MLLFAHTGIAVGVGRVLDRKGIPPIDYRVLLIGSMLPDIIDKPLGVYILRDFFSNGRIIAHTLLFNLLLFLLGVILLKVKGTRSILTLSAFSFLHLILDRIWEEPRVFLYPLYGFSFPKVELEGWLSGLIHSLTTDPSTYIPEIIGAFILILFLVEVICRKKLEQIILKGSIR